MVCVASCPSDTTLVGTYCYCGSSTPLLDAVGSFSGSTVCVADCPPYSTKSNPLAGTGYGY